MANPEDKQQVYKHLFLNLVYSMQTAALQNLGKLDHPMTNELEIDLEQAESYIELLDMLKLKTENNLADDEEKYLNTTLTDLKTLYVNAKNK